LSNNYLEKIQVLSEVLGECDYNPPHPEIGFYCPNCHHHKKKLMINLEKNVYKCWICGDKYSGFVIDLLKHLSRYDLIERYKQFLSNVLLDQDIKGLINSVFSPITAQFFIKKIIKLPEECKNINDYYGIINPYKNYLLSRGINNRLIEKYNIKFCDTGQYKNRVIIPSFNVDGNIDYFIARSIYKTGRKYLNPNEDKNNIIFNELFINWKTPIIIVEGVFDAIKVDYNCIPLLGSSLEQSLIQTKIMANKPNIYMMLDDDAYNKQLDMINKFIEWDIEVNNVKINKKDPGSMSKSQIFNSIKSSKSINSNQLLKEKILAL